MVISPISVKKEYEKLTNVLPERISELMAWLQTQPHLPSQYISELDVILAYHSCACNTESTKRVIDVNYTLRTLCPFYQNRKRDKYLELALQTWLIVPLPTMTRKGYKPIYCELLDADLEKFIYGDVIKAFLMVMDLWQFEEGTVPGVAIIVNLDRVSLGHISKIDIIVAQQFFYFLQEAMFVSLKEFHFINAPTFVDKLLALVRPFMKDELLDILKVHEIGGNTFDEYISIKDLWKYDSLDKTSLKNEISYKLKANVNFFEEESKKRVEESKRLGGVKSLSSFFPGLEDSFKTLNID